MQIPGNFPIKTFTKLNLLFSLSSSFRSYLVVHPSICEQIFVLKAEFSCKLFCRIVKTTIKSKFNTIKKIKLKLKSNNIVSFHALSLRAITDFVYICKQKRASSQFPLFALRYFLKLQPFTNNCLHSFFEWSEHY